MPRRLLPPFSRIALASSLLGAGTFWGLREMIRRTTFQPPRPASPVIPPADMQLLHAGDGVDVLFAPPPHPHGATIVYFHGNASDVASDMERVLEFREQGFGVAAVEYPGYGPHPKHRATQRRVISSCIRATQLVAEQPDVDELVLVGVSLGCALATQVAAHGLGDRMVLAAPFTSVVGLIKHHAPWAPARLLVNPHQLNSSVNIRQARCGMTTSAGGTCDHDSCRGRSWESRRHHPAGNRPRTCDHIPERSLHRDRWRQPSICTRIPHASC